MYTQCPECKTTFRLSAEDLRRASGKVRCGDCDHVFNALESLTEDVDESTTNPLATEHAIDDRTAAGWTSSRDNPAGDLSPDLDEYEATAYRDGNDEHPEADTIHSDDAFDEEENPGAILVIGDDEQPTAPGGGDETPAEPLPADEPDAARLAPDGEPRDEADFDDALWERVPGVSVSPDHATQDDSPEPDEQQDDSEANLEFDVPAEKWSNFFGPLPEGQTASVWQPPHLDDDTPEGADDAWDALTADESDGADDTGGETPAITQERGTPSWKGETPQPSRSAWFLPGAVLLVVTLAAQLVHYNRDRLAASTAWGERVRAFYALFGAELFPEWPVSSYEIRGSEAVAGESGRDVLDIRAQIANTGEHAVGLPRLRVVLRDRWSNPVAAQDFGPDEYAVDGRPADDLLLPGDMIGAHVSIQDPGSGAQGFELELCLPRRDTGMECTGQPFK